MSLEGSVVPEDSMQMHVPRSGLDHRPLLARRLQTLRTRQQVLPLDQESALTLQRPREQAQEGGRDARTVMLTVGVVRHLAWRPG